MLPQRVKLIVLELQKTNKDWFKFYRLYLASCQKEIPSSFFDRFWSEPCQQCTVTARKTNSNAYFHNTINCESQPVLVSMFSLLNEEPSNVEHGAGHGKFSLSESNHLKSGGNKPSFLLPLPLILERLENFKAPTLIALCNNRVVQVRFRSAESDDEKGQHYKKADVLMDLLLLCFTKELKSVDSCT